MQMLKDTPDVTRHSRWNDVKPKVEKDPRYQAVDSNSRRERWFKEYLRKLDDVSGNGSDYTPGIRSI